MSNSMTPRERLKTTMSGGKLDRFFRLDLGAWPSTIKRWKEEGMPHDASFHGDHFGFDPFPSLPFNIGFTDSPIFPVFEHTVLEIGDGWEIIRAENGIIMKVLSQDSDLSMPQFLEFPVKTRRDWDEIQKRLDPGSVSKYIGDISETAQKFNKMPDFPVQMRICGAFGHPRNLFGDENLFYMLYEDPKLIHEIQKNWLTLYKEIINHITAGIKVDMMMIWEDMCYKNGPLISPAHFREFIFPYYCELISYAKSRGIDYIWVDTDGDCLKLIPLFVESGVDALIPFEVQAGMDVVKIRKEMGDDFTIIGGIDKRALALSKDEIRKEVDRVVPFFIESGKYIPSLDHTVPVNVSYDNFLYYLECVRSYE